AASPARRPAMRSGPACRRAPARRTAPRERPPRAEGVGHGKHGKTWKRRAASSFQCFPWFQENPIAGIGREEWTLLVSVRPRGAAAMSDKEAGAPDRPVVAATDHSRADGLVPDPGRATRAAGLL